MRSGALVHIRHRVLSTYCPHDADTDRVAGRVRTVCVVHGRNLMSNRHRGNSENLLTPWPVPARLSSMLLCDFIAACRRASSDPVALGAPLAAGHSALFVAQVAGVSALSAAIDGSVRYVMGDDVTAAAVHVAASRPSSILKALPVARAPHASLWMEWLDVPRVEARSEAAAVGHREAPPAHRVGCLVTSDGEGRRGQAVLAWMHADQEAPGGLRVPSMSPLALSFDFDAEREGVVRPDIADTDVVRKWGGDPEETEALRALEATAGMSLTKAGAAVAQALETSAGKDAAQRMLDEARRDMDGEYLHLLALMLLLQSPNAAEIRGEDRSRLNRSRAKAGKPSLLDHRVAWMRLGARERRQGTGGGAGTAGPRRAHLVRGHFVMRSGTVFWRRAHVRGTGRPAVKTVKVSL